MLGEALCSVLIEVLGEALWLVLSEVLGEALLLTDRLGEALVLNAVLGEALWLVLSEVLGEALALVLSDVLGLGDGLSVVCPGPQTMMWLTLMTSTANCATERQLRSV